MPGRGAVTEGPCALPELPPGYRVLNDGEAREVLFREEWEEGLVFATRIEAAAWAWAYHRDYAE